MIGMAEKKPFLIMRLLVVLFVSLLAVAAGLEAAWDHNVPDDQKINWKCRMDKPLQGNRKAARDELVFKNHHLTKTTCINLDLERTAKASFLSGFSYTIIVLSPFCKISK
eukprot:sb/3477265/